MPCMTADATTCHRLEAATAAVGEDGRVALRMRVLLDLCGVRPKPPDGAPAGAPEPGASSPPRPPPGAAPGAAPGAPPGSPGSPQVCGPGADVLVTEAYEVALSAPHELADDESFLEAVQRCVELKRLAQQGGAEGWGDESAGYAPFVR